MSPWKVRQHQHHRARTNHWFTNMTIQHTRPRLCNTPSKVNHKEVRQTTLHDQGNPQTHQQKEQGPQTVEESTAKLCRPLCSHQKPGQEDQGPQAQHPEELETGLLTVYEVHHHPITNDTTDSSPFYAMTRFWQYIKSTRKDYTGVADIKVNKKNHQLPKENAD